MGNPGETVGRGMGLTRDVAPLFDLDNLEGDTLENTFSIFSKNPVHLTKVRLKIER